MPKKGYKKDFGAIRENPYLKSFFVKRVLKEILWIGTEK